MGNWLVRTDNIREMPLADCAVLELRYSPILEQWQSNVIIRIGERPHAHKTIVLKHGGPPNESLWQNAQDTAIISAQAYLNVLKQTAEAAASALSNLN